MSSTEQDKIKILSKNLLPVAGIGASAGGPDGNGVDEHNIPPQDEQVIAKKSMEESEHRYHELVNSSPSLISICKGENMIIEIANDAMLESWGKGNIIGKSVFDAVPESVEQGFDKLLLSVYKTGVPVQAYEVPVTLLRNGTKELIYYNFIYQPQRNVKGEIEGVATIATQVTPQAKFNLKIKESEAFSRSVLNSSPDCIKILDTEGRVQFMNDNGICLMEIDDFGKVKNNYWWDLWEEKNEQMIKDAVTKALSGERVQFQSMSNTAKGTPKWWDVIVAPILIDGETEKVKRIISVSRDITDFKDAMLKVEESEKRYNNLITFSPSAIGILQGEDLIITTANNAIIEIWGKGKEIMGKKYFEALPELAEQGYREVFAEVYKTGKPFNALETPVNILQNGKMQLKYYNFLLQAQRNIYGDIEGVGIIATEVTSQALVNLKIKASEEQFRLLVQQAPVAICVLRGKNYIIETINEGMVEMWGKKSDDVLNKPAFDVLPELLEQGFKNLLDSVYKSGERFVTEELPINLHRHGKLENAYVKFVYEPLREADGSISGVMALAHEITEQVLARKKIEESEKQFRILTNSMPQKIWTADAKGNKNYFNQTLLDYTGFSFEELRGQGWEKIIHPHDREENKKQWEESTSTGKDYEAENRLLRKDGKYLWHLTRAVALKDEDGKIKMWVGSKTEIHDQKTKEQAKDEFIAIASHELKTPLTTAKAYIQLLQLSMEKINDKDLMFAKKAGESIDRLNDLISELLDVSKIQNGKLPLHISTFNFDEMITASIEQVQHGAPMHNIIKSGEIDQPVTGDKQRLQQVVINLLTNAIKYSPENYKVFIHLVKENGDVTVSVKDNGIGIRKENLKKIFERYYREDGRAIHFQGLGIGLSICYEIIQRHDGKIWAESEPDRGSTFYFTIPI